MKALQILLLAVFFASVLTAQPTPEGNEFQVNPFDKGYQSSPAAGSTDDGRFVVVWRNSTNAGQNDGSGSSVWGLRYDSEGTPQDFSFLVNTFTTGPQSAPAVTMDAAGNFVIVWQSGDLTNPGPDGDRSSIQARRYNFEGTPMGVEFQVNTQTVGYQLSPAVGKLDDGRFVVVWEVAGFPFAGITGRTFAADGTPLTGEFGAGVGTRPDVDVSTDAFVVAWVNSFADPVETLAQRFAFNGTFEGGTITVNSMATGGYPAVSSDAAGNFVVVWGSRDAASIGVWGRLFDSNGAPLGAELDLDLAGSGSEPDVASDADGNFVAVWHSSDGSDFGIEGRSVSAAGVATSPPFQVNTYTTDQQWFAAVTSDTDGDLVAVWTGQDKESFGIKGQRFNADQALGPLIFADGFESGDTSRWSTP